MPNHVSNRITADAETIARIRERCSIVDEGRSVIDFNRLIRMPAMQPGVFYADGGLGAKEEAAHPRGNWYDWSPRFWGTKWNAYGQHADKNSATSIYFQTAWGHPEPIVYAIAAAVGGTWAWDYADEDTGFNLGRYEVRDGAVFFGETPPADGSPAARAFSYDVRGLTSEDIAERESDYADVG